MRNSLLAYTTLMLMAFAAPSLHGQTTSGPQAGTGQAIPDLSGIWEAPSDLNDLYENPSICGEDACGALRNKEQERPSVFTLITTIEEPQMLPWAEERFELAREGRAETVPVGNQDENPWFSACTSWSPSQLILNPFVAVEVRQFPDVVLLLFGGTAGDADHDVRRVYVDGRGHPASVQPTWMGHSIGSYDGDTLVVDTVGIKGNRWLDSYGHPHSDELHLVERIRRVNENSLEFEVTIDDPKAYKNTWAKKTVRMLAAPGPRVWEEVNCEELLQMGTHFGAEAQ